MNGNSRTVLVGPLLAALASHGIAAAQPDAGDAPPPAAIHASDLAVCAAIDDAPGCVLKALANADAPPAAPDAQTPAGGAALLAADKRGDAPQIVLQSIAALPDDDQIGVLTGLCRASVSLAPSWWGPDYRARRAVLRPSRPLALAAADRLEALLRKAGPEPDARTTLAACRAGLGDAAGANRAFDTLAQGSGDVRLQMLALIFGGQFDQAAALAETVDTEKVILPTMPLRSVLQFALLQRTRERLLWVAQNEGRPDVAARAAESLLTAALGEDRPVDRRMDSGLPAALAWLSAQPDPSRALSWVARADATVRPGQPGWNGEDALAVHRAWLKLGEPAKAQALYDAIAASPAEPTSDGYVASLASASQADPYLADIVAAARYEPDAPPTDAKVIAAAMLAQAGRWDEAAAAGATTPAVFRDDLRGGVGAAMLADRLSHARSDDERAATLKLCASSPAWDFSDPLSAPQPDAIGLELAAGCVRDLVTMGRLADGPTQAPGAASDATGLASPGLRVALRAIEADRADLAREMLGLTLAAWRGASGQGEAALDQRDLSLLVSIATGLQATR